MFNWFGLFNKSSQEATWNPTTMTMELQQPTSPEAPSTKRVDVETTGAEESTQMKLRGGGGVVPVFSALSVASAVARCKIPYLLPPLRRLVEYGYRHRWHITWLNWISARRAKRYHPVNCRF
ncbi:hypothetical protein N7471_006217 [Penicillium samsonianum]|uniref:uncharacterized protein n=1 Tax=Penicillium samsonianum TaxID=1882272 RepID=UPI002546FBCA|nr:uncharacterized protein N7471_006217 [Penicillium samsonianum]KAJ6139731.1 hypothetical protein N7471_006217 [Penicillium samsonianum]